MTGSAVLKVLIERLAGPAVILDARGRVRICSERFAQLVERSREELVGQSYAVFCDERWYGPSIGEAATSRCTIRTARGQSRAVELHAENLPGGEVLVTVLSWRVEEPRAPFPEALADLCYEISTEPADAGVLTCAWSRDGAASPLGLPCHQALWGSPRPCESCPFLPPPLPTDTTTRMGVICSPKGDARLVIGRRVGSTRVRVQVHEVAGNLVASLLEARIVETAKQADLTAREVDVLRRLTRGETLDEISAALGIAVRTAKYHQANVLAKVGVASRLELVRRML